MKYSGTVLSVSDVNASRKFCENLFGLELYQDYGINISFTCGLSLQQNFDWLTGLPKEKILKDANNMELCFEEADFDGFLRKLSQYPGVAYLSDVVEHGWGQRVVRFYDPDGHLIEVGEEMKMVVNRFLASGMSLAQVSKRMDVSIEDLEKVLSE